MMAAMDIYATVGALAVRVDSRQWDGLLALFAPRVRVDYTSLFGGSAETIEREELIDRWRALLPGFSSTTHVIGTPEVAIDGDTASVAAPVVAWHHIDAPELAGRDLWAVRGRYEMQMLRVDGVWRICELTLANAWQEGNTQLPSIAAKALQSSRP